MSTETKIFLCYAKEDKEKVNNIYKKLQELGFCPWMDIHDLFGGEEWKPTITKEIKNSEFFIAFLSNHSVQKRGFVNKEIKIALDVWDEKAEGQNYLIPVKLEDCEMPARLNYLHVIENICSDNGFEKLIKSISNPRIHQSEMDEIKKNEHTNITLRHNITISEMIKAFQTNLQGFPDSLFMQVSIINKEKKYIYHKQNDLVGEKANWPIDGENIYDKISGTLSGEIDWIDYKSFIPDENHTYFTPEPICNTSQIRRNKAFFFTIKELAWKVIIETHF